MNKLNAWIKERLVGWDGLTREEKRVLNPYLLGFHEGMDSYSNALKDGHIPPMKITTNNYHDYSRGFQDGYNWLARKSR